MLHYRVIVRILRFVIIALSLSCAPGMYATLPDYTIITDGGIPTVSRGSVIRLLVSSEKLGDKLTVDVWFPDAYSPSAVQGFPVVYAFDGQNLFDSRLSFSTVEWGIDEAVSRLVDGDGLTPPVIVGIHNRGAKNLRPNDYFPEKALAYIPEQALSQSYIMETCVAGFFGDEHAAFVAEELKPLIDNLFNTAPDSSHTFAMGSSMGALASLYLFCEYPDIFGGAACMSTHWLGSLKMNPDYTLQPDPVCTRALLDYLDAHLPIPASRRLYFDRGTTGWDAYYAEAETSAREIARRHGYSESAGTLMTHDAAGAGQNEWYWQQRVDRPLAFLLMDKSSGIDDVEADIDNSDSDSPLYDLLGRPVKGHPNPGIYIKNRTKILVR